MMMMMMVMMRVCWARGPEEVRLLGFFTEFAALSFFLSLGSSSSVFDRFQVLFCFVLLLLLLLETNFLWKPILCFRLLLFSREFDENFGVFPFFFSFLWIWILQISSSLRISGQRCRRCYFLEI